MNSKQKLDWQKAYKRKESKMKKILSMLITIILSMALVACVGSSGKRDAKLAGKYIGVSETSFGMTLTGNDVSGFTLELKKDGKASISLESENATGKWVSNDSTITITIDNEEIVGEIGEDTITFENFLEEYLGIELDITFAKEGTDAASPENYIPEEDKALTGEWVGVSVADVLGGDASKDVTPDFFTATLNADHTAVISFADEEISTPTWSFFIDSVLFEGEVADGANLYGKYKDDVFVITYSNDEEYYDFTMEKSGDTTTKH
jgi:hypothetical protein